MAARIASVEPGSLAAEAGLRPGDEILEINGIAVSDYLDFMFASCQEETVIRLAHRQVEIENPDYLPLGIGFDTLLIDRPRACRNRCVFCFIDQLPKGMRETCYFKDDDYRLSFLQGNYVSLTNMEEADVDRILRYSLPRINVSVHTTNPELRQRMLRNKRAGEVLAYLRRFAQGGLCLNAQIVLCPDWNDGAELNRTLKDLAALGPGMESISVVPVGLTDHRAGLEKLRLFRREEAGAVIRQIQDWQARFQRELGTRLVYPGDEFYLMAGLPMPDYDSYEGFPQLENGVGLCASLRYEFQEALALTTAREPGRRKTVATGKLAQGLLAQLAGSLPGDRIQVRAIENRFFGKEITVAGLITGQDLAAQLRGLDLGEELLIPEVMLRHDQPVFLDDMTLPELERALGLPVTPVPNQGDALLAALLR